MGSRYEQFDRGRLELRPLAERVHDLDAGVVRPLREAEGVDEKLEAVAGRVLEAAAGGAGVLFMMGAHVLRAGTQRYLIDMMERGLVSCVAMNGAGVIHDYEFATAGATTESVARYIRDGRFGLWRETARINDLIREGARHGLGLGEAVGRAIVRDKPPFAGLSVLGAAYRMGVPVTVHVGIGYDIIHEMPNCDGAALGETSYRDFLIFAKVVERLEGGVVMNFGSAVMGPEVFLKALAMCRNVAGREGREIRRFTTLVCDVAPLPEDCGMEPARDDPRYYFRPWKTLLARTVAGGGESFYVRGRHEVTVPRLWTALARQAARRDESS